MTKLQQGNDTATARDGATRRENAQINPRYWSSIVGELCRRDNEPSPGSGQSRNLWRVGGLPRARVSAWVSRRLAAGPRRPEQRFSAQLRNGRLPESRPGLRRVHGLAIGFSARLSRWLPRRI